MVSNLQLLSKMMYYKPVTFFLPTESLFFYIPDINWQNKRVRLTDYMSSIGCSNLLPHKHTSLVWMACQ